MGPGPGPQLERGGLDRTAVHAGRPDRAADRRRTGRGGGLRQHVGQPLQGAHRGAAAAARAADRAGRAGLLPHRPVHSRGRHRPLRGRAQRAAALAGRPGRPARRQCGGRRALARGLPQRRAAGHGGDHRAGAPRGRTDGLGPLPLGGCAAGRTRCLRRGLRGRLHVQVPQRRTVRAGLPIRGAAPPRRRRTAVDRMVRTRRAVRLPARLPAGRGHRTLPHQLPRCSRWPDCGPRWRSGSRSTCGRCGPRAWR